MAINVGIHIIYDLLILGKNKKKLSTMTNEDDDDISYKINKQLINIIICLSVCDRRCPAGGGQYLQKNFTDFINRFLFQ